MALQENPNDVLQYSSSCSQWADYPGNLLFRPEFGHELDEYQEKINVKDEKTILFHPTARQLHFWDLSDNHEGHVLSDNLKANTDVRHILDSETVGPLERYIFVQSASSRGPLGCEKEQLLTILSRNQVMPSFLDIVFTFKTREHPHTRTTFAYETCLGLDQPKLSVPSKGISGFRIQHCFNLIGVEKDESRPDGPWFIRQTAAYHSFDVVYRRSVWLVLKGNKLIRQRLQADTKSQRNRFPHYTQTVQGCFLANLRSHLLIYQWSSENWEDYIEYLEAKFRRTQASVDYTPILESIADEGIESTLKKNDTWRTLHSRQNSGLSKLHTSSTTISGRVVGFFRSSSGLDSQLHQSTSPSSTVPAAGMNNVDTLDLDKMFSFDQLQLLHRLGARIQGAIDILSHNKRLLKDMKQYFQELVASREFENFVDLKAYSEDMCLVYRRIDKIHRSMENYQERLQQLLHELEKITTSFNDILQYRNMRMGEFFSKQGQMLAMQAKISTDSMHIMSLKSRREAVSMHVITIWTLIFLPGTFVATFFSSGILNFEEVRKFGDWGTSWVGLELFFIICCPIMLLTLAGWGFFWYQARESKSSKEFELPDIEKGGLDATFNPKEL